MSSKKTPSFPTSPNRLLAPRIHSRRGIWAPARWERDSWKEKPRPHRPPANVAGPGPVPITLNINGKPIKLTVEPRVTLLDAMRNHLDLTGAKRVCDRATCGACTVILNGKTVYSCTVLAIDAQGKKIETIEGLAAPGKLHPVSQAFWDNDAQQCGYCTPGVRDGLAKDSWTRIPTPPWKRSSTAWAAISAAAAPTWASAKPCWKPPRR